ncbi:MAG: hypothetical protein PHT78_09745 [Desulfitobacteriaceae bacterium]|nr:hypothetical protein [Desulfitobacteriaceae bacterium]MDD4753510.1 hypothetical protein [Desulfitobacteriaceae bacterium]
MPEKKKPHKMITPGMEDVLNEDAGLEEKKSGNYTRVTTFSWDEVDNR